MGAIELVEKSQLAWRSSGPAPRRWKSSSAGPSRKPTHWCNAPSGAMSKNFLSAGVLAAIVGAAPAASAFCRTTTCDQNNRNEQCVKEDGCIVTGLPLYWTGRCISFSVDYQGSPKRGIPYDTALSVISEAYRQWQNADCGEGQSPSLSMRLFPPSRCDRPTVQQGRRQRERLALSGRGLALRQGRQPPRAHHPHVQPGDRGDLRRGRGSEHGGQPDLGR